MITINAVPSMVEPNSNLENVPSLEAVTQWANGLFLAGNPAANAEAKVEEGDIGSSLIPDPNAFFPEQSKNAPLEVMPVGSCPDNGNGRGGEYYFLPKTKEETSGDPPPPPSNESLGVQALRKDFPILSQKINGKPLIWFDNAATTQKPQAVIDSLNGFYSEYNSNVHRATHTMAKKATTAFENAREKVQRFLGATSPEEIVFLRGTTEAINLVAQAYGRMNIHAGDEILISQMEHHSNIVPWQMLRDEKRAVIKVIPINDRGEISLEKYKRLFTLRTRMVAISHVSNVLGTINPVAEMIQIAHAHRACVLVDGAQSVPHFPVHVKSLDADFYAFSGHKIYGPTGIGVLYGKKALLETMPPWQGGGSMIKQVTFDKTLYNNIPYKFEAGTPNVADAIGLGTAIDYLQKIGLGPIENHERHLTGYAMESLLKIPGLCVIGTALNKISVISFIMRNLSPDQAAQHLEKEGIAVRTGHHCAQPALERFGLTDTLRVSLGLYNTKEEVDTLCSVLHQLARQSQA